MIRICVVTRESCIKARIVKIRSNEQSHIEETIKLVNNGISHMLLSHARISGGYQMFLDSDADGEVIFNQVLDVFSGLPEANVVIEKINC
jgi:hypothetical protein